MRGEGRLVSVLESSSELMPMLVCCVCIHGVVCVGVCGC